jgi:predicted CoA-substrate-specific enzyme activase
VSINLGVDIGAVSIKLAALGTAVDRPLLAGLCASNARFRLVEASSVPLVVSDYARILGSPIEAAYELLRAFYAAVPEERVEGMRVTGSGSRTIARLLGIYFENGTKATARAVARLHPGTKSVLEIGGETSSFLRLDPDDPAGLILDYDRGGDCAAGTGSFLDQQAARLGYGVQEISRIVATAARSARIAGRCSVFAKSDMIHAQQQGCTPAEILRGLCRAVAQNYKSSVLKGREVEGPALFVGGVAANAGVAEAMAEALGADRGTLQVPPLAAWLGAIGAALLESDETKKRSLGEIHRLRQHAGERRPAENTPLRLDRVVLLRNEPAPAPPRADGPVDGFLGIDVGSVSTNLVVVDDGGRVLFDEYLRTAGRPVDAVQAGLRSLEAAWGGRLRVLGVGTTGSGRELAAEYVGADAVHDEITAHKTGAVHVSRARGGRLVDTIFEIGGQDSKYIAIEDGVVVDFAMNEACAAGTGSFLEEQADKLGIGIKNEFATLALSAPSPTRLGERCTVFMERDVTAWLHRGEPVPALVAGLAYSIALNYLNRVVRGRRIGDVIYFQGGTAYNDAVAAAFAGILGKTITVPPYNGVMGALGMALIAMGRRHEWRDASRFRGYDLGRLEQRTRDFVCRACANECSVREFTIEGQKSYWGDKCSDRYRKPSRSSRRPVVEDLVEYRDRLVEQATGVALDAPPAIAGGRLSVGLPRAMSTIERYPFWHTYLAEIGVQPVLSATTDKRVVTDGMELAPAQPCFPVQVAHGHVSALFDLGVDYVLVPNLLDNESNEASSCVAHFCPWTQTLPFVLRSAPRLEPLGSRILAPSLHFQMGVRQVREELRELGARLGASRRASDRAADRAFEVQRWFQDEQIAAGRRALATLDETGEPGLVLLGRAYNIYDRAINCDIPRKLRTYYGANVVPVDFLVTGRELVDAPGDNMYWTSGRRMLHAARMVAERRGLHIVYITNFKCGPDSYIKHYARQAAGAPLLVLQFDGHGNDAGYLTRCEAFLDSKGILGCQRDEANEVTGNSATTR